MGGISCVDLPGIPDKVAVAIATAAASAHHLAGILKTSTFFGNVRESLACFSGGDQLTRP